MDEKTSWETFFKMMIADEHGAQKKYEMAGDLAESPELKKVFAKLAGEEQFHAQILEGEMLKLEKKQVNSKQ
ncbi:MAG TPA: ferritin family protein [Anaerolineae bacterium]